MIALKRLDTQEQFHSLAKGQELIVHWKEASEEHRKGNKISMYKMVRISDDNELILKVKGNVYFNISMYLKGLSAVEDVSIVVPENLLRTENQRLRKELEDVRRCFDHIYVQFDGINASKAAQRGIQSIESALHSPTAEKEATCMPEQIPWIAYNPQNPPPLDIKYLITDGIDTDFGQMGFDAFDEEYLWLRYDNCQFSADHITHYAVINLPAQEGDTEV
ncbi:hypothetical protein PaeCFBP13512_22410 [Paenibacillus sp. CFBP13512]|uniref:hypothetical protein n=1 Tax=Paenibacillus sp. CFBP13512 TaxID=2184007 RepID=UPI0010BFE05B|nr:hypothetical protein [Paenibacillus sp. CFBP13512]TKJ83772.1 hypothetical protein PaeCFBP13512_22410 [Paenibacillus sp. CFBP13512]